MSMSMCLPYGIHCVLTKQLMYLSFSLICGVIWELHNSKCIGVKKVVYFNIGKRNSGQIEVNRYGFTILVGSNPLLY
jgi:hypothetical protein